jgi:hypothetical protein
LDEAPDHILRVAVASWHVLVVPLKLVSARPVKTAITTLHPENKKDLKITKK